jgi:hypothetical protein
MTAFTERLEGPSPAAEIAKDMVRRGLPMLPVGLVIGALWEGTNGALSVGYAMVLILTNFLLSAYLLGWAAQISFAMVAGASLGGYVMRLALVFIAVYVVKDMSWVALVPMCIAIIVTHLGLLIWELRYVSASMAYPGLKPSGNGRSVANSAR